MLSSPNPFLLTLFSDRDFGTPMKGFRRPTIQPFFTYTQSFKRDIGKGFSHYRAFIIKIPKSGIQISCSNTDSEWNLNVDKKIWKFESSVLLVKILLVFSYFTLSSKLYSMFLVKIPIDSFLSFSYIRNMLQLLSSSTID